MRVPFPSPTSWLVFVALALGAFMFARGNAAGEALLPANGGWAFKPVSRPAFPARGQSASFIGNPIDRFIRARLAENNLQPSSEADPATLIRRMTFDLTGLPPTPDEVDAFLKAAIGNPQPAIESLVDRLLASPRYGERWARHWLDVVHFGETHGYDKDKLRTAAWPYRDYVIRSLNRDKPWSRFVEEQLAGDVLHPDDPEGIAALGFIAAGPWDFVGHVELPIAKTDGLIARYNDRDDMVMTTFSAFQSLTVHCARCHDHKFDPISAKDYYGLQSVFAGVDRANRTYDPDPATHRQRRALTLEKPRLEARRQELKRVLDGISSPELMATDQRIAGLNLRLGTNPPPTAAKKSSSNGYHSDIEPSPDATKWVQLDLGRDFELDEIRLVPARPTDFPDTPGFGFPVRFKVELSDVPDFHRTRLVMDHTGSDIKNPGDAPFVIMRPPPDYSGLVSSGTGARPRWAVPVMPTGGTEEVRGRYLRVTATRLWERTKDYVFALAEVQAFVNRTNIARGVPVSAADSIEAGRWSRKALVDGHDSRAVLEDVLPRPEEGALRREAQAALKRAVARRARLLDALAPPETKDELARVETRLAEVNSTLAGLPEPQRVYAAASDFKPEGNFLPAGGMRPVHQLTRGDVKQPRELATPAGLACVPGPDSSFNLATSHTEGDRRAALARWLTDPRNLQTRRSIVNRVWQYHFGRGLVDTPNDFGHMGGTPTHPELLDWLAFWFQENGESLKKLHRLMVTSAAYRQRSVISESVTSKSVTSARTGSLNTDSLITDHWNRASALDADNRLLWRMHRTRLDAECIRDAMLAASGQLDLTMGGPSDRQFHFKDDHSPVYDYTRFDVDSPAGRRRSIYRLLVRSVPDPFMDCLDTADPSQLVARRNTTLTALQALAVLNNPFVLKQCEHFAERLQKLAPDVPGQIDAAYRLALSRPPTVGEKERLAAYASKHGLANACRVIFNSTEFMFVD